MRSRGTPRVNVLVRLVVALWCVTHSATTSGTSGASPSSTGSIDVAEQEGPISGTPSDAGSIPCIPVATAWPVVGGDPPKVTAPQWAVVLTDFRPKDVQLHLDGRFIGRARYFNGKKGNLFLEPGSYRLEARLGGYRSEVFEIEARPSCRFEIRHRMTRSAETAKESRGDPPGNGIPTQRVFSPVGGEQMPHDRGAPGGPDLGLRPDLRGRSSPAITSAPRTSSLIVKVEPAAASVFLDGSFLATGEELALMVGPVAISAGSHLVEVRAPGFVSREIELEIGPGELEEITVSLQGIEDN
jgi:hypothetical protein